MQLIIAFTVIKFQIKLMDDNKEETILKMSNVFLPPHPLMFMIL